MKKGPQKGSIREVYVFEDVSRASGVKTESRCPKCNSIAKIIGLMYELDGKREVEFVDGANIHRWHKCLCGYRFRTVDFFKQPDFFDATKAIPIRLDLKSGRKPSLKSKSKRQEKKADMVAEKILASLSFMDAMKMEA
jgi:hypothetical protein